MSSSMNGLIEQWHKLDVQVSELVAQQKKLEGQIKAKVLESGESYTGSPIADFMIKEAHERRGYSKPKLDGLALVYLEIAQCATVTAVKASVTIKRKYKRVGG